MSRIHKIHHDIHIDMWYGNDHAIGKFVDLSSQLYADTEEDEQGEGYIFEYSDLFGYGINLADLTLKEVMEETPEFFQKIEAFHKSLNLKANNNGKS